MPIELVSPAREYAEVRSECERAVCETLASGRYILGENVREIEHAFAQYVGAQHAVGVANGTDALCLALRALGIGAQDEVITTPYTFFATAEAIAAVGAVPVFCDVRPDSYNLDPDGIAPLVTPRTKAVVAVHLFGQCAEMDAINVAAKRRGLFVIEDACQAAGAWYKGRMAGSLADAACFSFFPTKNLGCAGDGGMITTDYACVADIAKGLRAHGGGAQGARAAQLLARRGADKLGMRIGQSAAQAQTDGDLPAGGAESCGKPKPDIPPNADASPNPDASSGDKYFNHLVGVNSRLDEVQAAILRVKLKCLDGFLERKREIASFYTQALAGVKGVTLPKASATGAHAWHMYVLRAENRDKLRQFLAGKGISTAVYYPVPLHLQPALAQLGYREGDFPVAEQLCKEAIAIPLFAQMTELERWLVADSIKEFYG